MKKLNILLLLFVAFFSSCNEDFLDERPTNAISDLDAINNEGDLLVALNGVYDRIRDDQLYNENFLVYGDLMSDNVFISTDNTNRFTRENVYDWSPSATGDTGTSYGNLYQVLSRANFMLQAPIAESATVNNLKGEALIVRALCHFELVKYWSQPVSSGVDQEFGAALVTTYDRFQTPARSTVAQTYDQIETDLTTAISMITEDPGSNTRLGRTAARLLLARINLYKGNYGPAQNFAEDVLADIGNYVIPRAEYVSYWGLDERPGTIWATANTATDNFSQESAFGIYDPGGYGDALVTKELFDLIPATDIRKDLLRESTKPDVPVGYWIDGKYKIGFADGGIDNKILRTAEAWLIAAEAAYENNAEGTARTYLETLMNQRISGYSAAGLSGQALLDEILLQRRIELVAEGHRYFDLARRGMPIVKGANCISNCNLPIGSGILAMPIPENNFETNPNLVQNPAYN